MRHSGPGKSHREGISVFELSDMFPDEGAARAWFEAHVWPEGRYCPRCGSTRTHEAKHPKMPYRCTDCRAYFSVKTGTALESSKIPLRKWVFAIYMEATSLKGVSSMKLHRELKVTQRTAWFMLHRLREAWSFKGPEVDSGPLEVDETFMGGKRKNMPKAKRAKLEGRGTVGKTVVAGARDRETNRVTAAVVERTDARTLQGFVAEHAAPGATVYTDGASAYKGMPFDHDSVTHSAGEYVKGDVHTQGIESFWATIKRAQVGTFHKISPKHMQRYIDQFAGKHNIREADTIDQMTGIVAGMVRKRLLYRNLVA